MEQYIVVMCQASLIVINEYKKKGYLTIKEKLHVLHFLSFIVNDFQKNIQLEHNPNHNGKKCNIVSTCETIVNTP